MYKLQGRRLPCLIFKNGYCIAQLWIPNSQLLPAVYDHIPSTFLVWGQRRKTAKARPKLPAAAESRKQRRCLERKTRFCENDTNENVWHFTGPFGAFGSVHRISAVSSGVLGFRFSLERSTKEKGNIAILLQVLLTSKMKLTTFCFVKKSTPILSYVLCWPDQIVTVEGYGSKVCFHYQNIATEWVAHFPENYAHHALLELGMQWTITDYTKTI